MFYPVMLRVGGRRCVVVGGGAVAARKAKSLLDAGGDVLVVAPKALRMPRGATVSRARFAASHLRGAALAIAATDDAAVNRRVFDAAARRGIPVNVVDVPALCTFIVPSVIRRGPVLVAVSTSGESPMLARTLRRDLQRLLPRGIGRLARTIGRARRGLRSAGARRAVASGAILALLRDEGLRAATRRVRRRAGRS